MTVSDSSFNQSPLLERSQHRATQVCNVRLQQEVVIVNYTARVLVWLDETHHLLVCVLLEDLGEDRLLGNLVLDSADDGGFAHSILEVVRRFSQSHSDVA